MQEIIVLGRIPGTEWQLSFEAWVFLIMGIMVLSLVHITWRELAARWDIRRANLHTTRIFHTMQHYRQY